MKETQPIRIEMMDYRWLMENRGSGSVPEKVHELIEYYRYREGKPLSRGSQSGKSRG